MQLVRTLGDDVTFYKVHWVLMLNAGIKFVEELISLDKKVFLDLKMWDIDETIENSIRSISNMGVEFVTLHGNGATLRAAKKGRDSRPNPKFLSVTLLSSLDQTDLKDILFKDNIKIEDYIQWRVGQLLEDGCDALIASGESVGQIKEAFTENNPTVITPGIRPTGTNHHDHKRALTPTEAILAGSDYLVVGRPIYTSGQPQDAARSILEEIDKALTL